MLTYRVTAYNAFGEKVKEFEAEVPEEDGAKFIAHHVLHIDGVACCEILDLAAELMFRQCDPGLEFDEVVRQ